LATFFEVSDEGHNIANHKQEMNKKQTQRIADLASQNCVEAEIAYTECLTTFSTDRFFTMCAEKSHLWNDCKQFQKEFISKLDLTMSDDQLMNLADAAFLKKQS
jgi:hypothetical protein